MNDACAAQPQGYGFLSSMTHFVDCQALALGSGGWQALSMPGSSLSLVLTGLSTIFIAVIGYQLLLGERFTIRWATLAAVKLGAVFLLATSWPAYRTLVYDVVTDGPSQIVGDLGRPSGLPGSDGTLMQRLDRTDAALNELAILGTGIPASAQPPQVAPPPFAGFSAFALGGSRIIFLIAALGSLLAIRGITGLMLALGPFFAAFLMFDNTRSFFEGWVRVLAGAALAAIGTAVALGLELSLLEPWLAAVLAKRVAGEAMASLPVDLFVLTSVFAMLVLAMLVAAARVAWAFRLAPLIPAAAEAQRPVFGAAGETRVPTTASRDAGERSRAAATADLLVSIDRRAARGRALAGANRIATVNNSPTGRASITEMQHSAPVGRAFARRSRTRIAASADRRDKVQ